LTTALNQDDEASGDADHSEQSHRANDDLRVRNAGRTLAPGACCLFEGLDGLEAAAVENAFGPKLITLEVGDAAYT